MYSLEHNRKFAKQLSKKHISLEFWKLYTDFPNEDWSWSELSCNPNITLEIIKNNLHLPWSWSGISRNPNLTIEMTNTRPLEQWSWEYVSGNSNITMKNINDNLHLPWNWTSMSTNPNLTVEMIIEHSLEQWSWAQISKNENITLETIYKHPELSWSWPIMRHGVILKKNLSNRNTKVFEISKITANMIDDNPHYPWNWTFICRCPDVTIKVIDRIAKHLEYSWLWKEISENKFDGYRNDIEQSILKTFKNTKVFEEELTQKVLHPKRIQRYIRQYNYNLGTDKPFIL